MRRNPDTEWPTKPVHKRRELRGLTSAGCKSLGLGKSHKFTNFSQGMSPGGHYEEHLYRIQRCRPTLGSGPQSVERQKAHSDRNWKTTLGLLQFSHEIKCLALEVSSQDDSAPCWIPNSHPPADSSGSVPVDASILAAFRQAFETSECKKSCRSQNDNCLTLELCFLPKCGSSQRKSRLAKPLGHGTRGEEKGEERCEGKRLQDIWGRREVGIRASRADSMMVVAQTLKLYRVLAINTAPTNTSAMKLASQKVDIGRRHDFAGRQASSMLTVNGASIPERQMKRTDEAVACFRVPAAELPTAHAPTCAHCRKERPVARSRQRSPPSPKDLSQATAAQGGLQCLGPLECFWKQSFKGSWKSCLETWGSAAACPAFLIHSQHSASLLSPETAQPQLPCPRVQATGSAHTMGRTHQESFPQEL
ncbi:hypothetical protein U0070_011896 [Myodes glareolus]|uniref:Ribosomal protein L15 n=1 Tax=Myodes glareolus TaxID=447135 RepID=A0AAW0HG20_MYOGA